MTGKQAHSSWLGQIDHWLAVVESAWGAVPGLLRVRFPRLLTEPAVPIFGNGLSTVSAVRCGWA